MSDPGKLLDVSIEHDIDLYVMSDGTLHMWTPNVPLLTDANRPKVDTSTRLTVKLLLPVALRNRINQLREAHKNGICEKACDNA